MAQTLTDLQVAAALAEMSYRRDAQDQAIMGIFTQSSFVFCAAPA